MPDSWLPVRGTPALAGGERVGVRTIKNRNRQHPPLHRRRSVRTAAQASELPARAASITTRTASAGVLTTQVGAQACLL
jgi:hypothetical protein